MEKEKGKKTVCERKRLWQLNSATPTNEIKISQILKRLCGFELRALHSLAHMEICIIVILLKHTKWLISVDVAVRNDTLSPLITETTLSQPGHKTQETNKVEVITEVKPGRLISPVKLSFTHHSVCDHSFGFEWKVEGSTSALVDLSLCVGCQTTVGQ